MKREKFEDIEAWQKARQLVQEIYQTAGQGRLAKDFGLRDQIRSAAVSIMSSIAEGFGRRSNREFANFLNYSHGSIAELQSHLYIARDQSYIKKETFASLYKQCDEISHMVLFFSMSLRKK